MRKITKIAVAVFLGLLIIATVLAGIGVLVLFSLLDSEPAEDSFRHEVEYNLNLRTNGTLNDTEIIVPYPEDKRFQSAINGNTSNVSIHNDLNASLSIVETERGEILKLDIGDFTPETRDERFDSHRNYSDIEPKKGEKIREANVTGLAEYSTYDLVIRAEYNRSLDTRNGLENEPHLQSSSAPCQSPYGSGCATTEAFMSYNTSNDTHTELDVRLEGRNSWWNLGWSSNTYGQRFYYSFYDNQNLIGPQDNWITLQGREEQGEGNYRK